MSSTVARVSEISSLSNKSFEEAIADGIKRSQETLRNVKSAWIKEQTVNMNDDGSMTYQVNMQITFVLE